MTYSAAAMTDDLRLKNKYYFHIPQQRADKALTALAEQANITLIFPYDKVKDIWAHPLEGNYSTQEALAILLADTGLVMSEEGNGQLTVILDPIRQETIAPKKNTFSLFSNLFGVGSGSAQESTESEEVIVTGIRASIQKSMNTKRNASGVVDAISAEDIGKMPDTNLAESLQRITGVSINRSSGEGAQVTVRGFGPEFNAVLLNGRLMPSRNNSRAFDFDNLASELVSGVEVYKTARTDLPSGGVGSTINIKTAKPFDLPDFKATATLKESTDLARGKYTPQASGLISGTFSDGKLGALLALSHSVRDSREGRLAVDAWKVDQSFLPSSFDNSANQTNHTFAPQNFEVRQTEATRTRENGSLVLQYKPIENLTLSTDYQTYSLDSQRTDNSMGVWFTTNLPGTQGVVADKNGTVTDISQTDKLNMFGGANHGKTENNSLGFNANWDMSASLNINFDANFAESKQNPNGELETNASLISFKSPYQFVLRDNDLPYITEYNPNYLDPSLYRAHIQGVFANQNTDKIDEIRFDMNWNSGSTTGLTKARIGMMNTKQSKNLVVNNDTGTWCFFCGLFDQGQGPDIPDEWLSTDIKVGSDFLGTFAGHEKIPHAWLKYNVPQLHAFLEAEGQKADPTFTLAPSKKDDSYSIEENTTSIHVEMEFVGDLAGKPLHAVTGFRYEKTGVTATATEQNLVGLKYVDTTAMDAVYSGKNTYDTRSDYTFLLPSFSVDLKLSENVVARMASSRTLTRPSLGSMNPALIINTTRQGGDLKATSGNPTLKPYNSDNLDLSLEWYYATSSYMSIGYFSKDVTNFIVGSSKKTDINSVKDISTGSDITASDPNDSVALFEIQLPSNGQNARLTGIELALQHAFGKSGFGIMANATIVNTNANLDPKNVSTQFALPGASDSRNFGAYFEGGGFQVRAVYNWRDQFLLDLNQAQQAGEPVFVNTYGQWDMSASYKITEQISIIVDGINITSEHYRSHGRYDNQLIEAIETGPRYAIGLKAVF